jgi:hypothetical protein
MKQIQLNGIKYKCPTSWEDITIKDQIRVSQIAQEHTGLTKNLQLISGYANIPVEEIKTTHINKLTGLVGHLSFLSEPINEDPITEFEHKGHKYNIMPTLLEGQFQDFISLDTVMSNFKDDKYQALPMMIAILAKREGETLDDYDVEERAKEFLDLPIDIANRIAVFFSQVETLSQINTLTSSSAYQEKIEQELIKQLDVLENTIRQSDGQGLLGRLQKWMSLKYVKYFKKDLNSYLTGTQLKS